MCPSAEGTPQAFNFLGVFVTILQGGGWHEEVEDKVKVDKKEWRIGRGKEMEDKYKMDQKG